MKKTIAILILLSVLNLSCHLDKLTDLSLTVPMPEFDIDLSNNDGFAPCIAKFGNSSVNSSTFTWDFGDGTPISTLLSPNHTYEKPGTYVVKLISASSNSIDSITKLITIKPLTFIKKITNAAEGGCIQLTSDGGYVITGASRKGFLTLSNDLYWVKTDLRGTVVWESSYGTENNDTGADIKISSDGGYIMAGSIGLDTTSNPKKNSSLAKIDSIGFIIWDKSYGDLNNRNIAASVLNTIDGGYVFAGTYQLLGFGNQDKDVHLVKVDNLGNVLWDKKFGGIKDDIGASVINAQDGGYVIVGNTKSKGAGQSDIYLIKTNANGDLIWDNTFGGVMSDNGYSVVESPDGGYIIIGSTDISFNRDIYLIKTNSIGQKIWEKNIGTADIDTGVDIQNVPEGGYVIAGTQNSHIFLARIDGLGNIIWQKTYIDISLDEVGYGVSVVSARDGGFALVGNIYNSIGNLMYIIKTDKDGNAQ